MKRQESPCLIAGEYFNQADITLTQKEKLKIHKVVQQLLSTLNPEKLL
ncbi:MAG: hypothetical protein ACBR12_17415 [Microcoleus sp.]